MKRLSFLLATMLLASTAIQAIAADSTSFNPNTMASVTAQVEKPIGTIMTWTTDVAPPTVAGEVVWLPCDGQAIPSGAEYDPLRILLNSNNLPNLNNDQFLKGSTTQIGKQVAQSTISTTINIPAHKHDLSGGVASGKNIVSGGAGGQGFSYSEGGGGGVYACKEYVYKPKNLWFNGLEAESQAFPHLKFYKSPINSSCTFIPAPSSSPSNSLYDYNGVGEWWVMSSTSYEISPYMAVNQIPRIEKLTTNWNFMNLIRTHDGKTIYPLSTGGGLDFSDLAALDPDSIPNTISFPFCNYNPSGGEGGCELFCDPICSIQSYAKLSSPPVTTYGSTSGGSIYGTTSASGLSGTTGAAGATTLNISDVATPAHVNVKYYMKVKN